jgi:cobalt-zinc-cadmium efflux system membrane fusion protein
MTERLTRRLPRHAVTALAMVLLASAAGCNRHGAVAADDDEKHESARTEPAEAAHHDRVKLSKEAAEENRLKVEPVTKRVLTPRLHAAARVALNAEATARVSTPVGGRVAEVKAHLGDVVRRGDELVLIESTDLGEAQSDLLQKNAARAAAEAAAEAARDSYQRGLELLEKAQGVARGEVDKRHADLLAAQAAARSAAVAASAARTRLKLRGMPDDAIDRVAAGGMVDPTYAIRSPVDGSVIRLDVTRGMLVAPDKDALLDVADLRTVWVLADVPEPMAGSVRAGAAAHVVAAQGANGWDGKVAYVSPIVDPATRSVPVRIVVQNEGGALRPGTFVTADIEQATDKPPEPVPAVPDGAVQTIEGESVVFVPVEGEEETFEKRVVKVGEAVGGFVPVESGLHEGEKVVTEGAFVLKAELSKPAEEE